VERQGLVLQPPPPAALLSRCGRHHHDALMLRLVKVLQVRALRTEEPADFDVYILMYVF
jgi:hypothetical protein